MQIYKNQERAAESVLVNLTKAKEKGNKTHSVMLYAPTQSGKSGIMISIMEGVINSNVKRNLGENVKFALVAPADSALRSQLTEDLKKFRKNRNICLENFVVYEREKNPVYGTPTLKSLTCDLKREICETGPTTLIVLIDEAHIATKSGQQLDKALSSAELLTENDILNSFDSNELISNIFVVWVSATPWNYLEHYNKNNLNYECVSLDVDAGYIGASDVWGKMQPCASLESLAGAIKESALHTPSLSVVRVTNQKDISALKQHLPDADFDIIELTSASDDESSQRAKSILKNCKISDDPVLRNSGKSVVIVVKQMLGFGQRIGNIGEHDLRIICEFSERSTFDLVQGLFGRVTGYTKNINNVRFFLGATSALQKKYKFSNTYDYVQSVRNNLLLQIQNPFNVMPPTKGGGLKPAQKSPGFYEHAHPLVIDFNPEDVDQQVLKDMWIAQLEDAHIPADLIDDAKKFVDGKQYEIKVVTGNIKATLDQIKKAPRPHNIGDEQVRASADELIAIETIEPLDVVMTHPRARHAGATSSSSMSVRYANDKEKGQIVYVVTFGLRHDILMKFKEISSITSNKSRAQKHVVRANNVQ
jgi:hypothetical protein